MSNKGCYFEYRNPRNDVALIGCRHLQLVKDNREIKWLEREIGTFQHLLMEMGRGYSKFIEKGGNLNYRRLRKKSVEGIAFRVYGGYISSLSGNEDWVTIATKYSFSPVLFSILDNLFVLPDQIESSDFLKNRDMEKLREGIENYLCFKSIKSPLYKSIPIKETTAEYCYLVNEMSQGNIDMNLLMKIGDSFHMDFLNPMRENEIWYEKILNFLQKKDKKGIIVGKLHMEFVEQILMGQETRKPLSLYSFIESLSGEGRGIINSLMERTKSNI